VLTPTRHNGSNGTWAHAVGGVEASPQRRYVRWFGLLLVAVAMCGCGDPEHSATVGLPGSPYVLRVVLKASHPFLAEYDRSFRVERDGRATREDVELFPDTGGYARVNLYQLGSAVLLQTVGNDEYLIDANTGVVTTRPIKTGEPVATRPSGATFMGAFDFDERDRFVFIPQSTRSEKPIGGPR